MKTYKKLVRDRIPEIITARGDVAVTRTLSDGEFLEKLREKLCEEVQEFLSDGTAEELADIYEVLLAILDTMGISPATFERMRSRKTAERGGFSQKIFLESVIEQNYRVGDHENDT